MNVQNACCWEPPNSVSFLCSCFLGFDASMRMKLIKIIRNRLTRKKIYNIQNEYKSILQNFVLGGQILHTKELQSKTVEWLRFPMSVMVVFIHYYGKELIKQPELGTCIYDSIRVLLCHVISRAAVPL